MEGCGVTKRLCGGSDVADQEYIEAFRSASQYVLSICGALKANGFEPECGKQVLAPEQILGVRFQE